MKYTELVCAGCGEVFSKPTKEVVRQQLKNPNRTFYCKMTCYAEHTGKHNLGPSLGCGDISRMGGKRATSEDLLDDFSPYRYFMRKARSRSQHTVDIDLAHLKALWASQDGKCALSGRPLQLPKNCGGWESDTKNPWKPSLDRIDSARGYVKGNVRFVSMIANLCKQSWSDAEVLEFCKAVAQHNA